MPRGVKKSGVNISAAIREYLKTNRKATPAEIKEAMKAKGIEASDSLISAVKYRKGKKKRGKPGRKPGAAKAAGSSISVDTLIAANKLVESLGGIEKASRAIDVLKRLHG
jgi:hypothetical protein